MAVEFQDYYSILGIEKTASQNEIQRAYRKLARKFHPDVNKKTGAEERFKEISEANQVLKDPEKRKRYDTYGKNWEQGEFRPPPDWQTRYRQPGKKTQTRTFHFKKGSDFEATENYSDFFNTLFGNGLYEDIHTDQAYSQNTQSRSAEAEISLSISDVYHGTSRMISYQVFEDDGQGQIKPVTKTLDVKIPKGLTNGSVIRLAGQGGKGMGSKAPGNLLLKINIIPDPRFRIDGHNLYTIVSLSPWEAALGAKIPIETVDVSLTLNIPPGSQNGRKLRLRGKGLPKRDGSRGDLIAELDVCIPDSLNENEEKLFKELARISGYNPRKDKKQRDG